MWNVFPNAHILSPILYDEETSKNQLTLFKVSIVVIIPLLPPSVAYSAKMSISMGVLERPQLLYRYKLAINANGLQLNDYQWAARHCLWPRWASGIGIGSNWILYPYMPCSVALWLGIYKYGQVWLYTVNVMIANLILDWCYGVQYLIHCMH